MQVSNVRAKLQDDGVVTSYTVTDCDSASRIKMTLRPIWLSDFVDETGMNDSGLPTCFYLVRNLLEVVERYLEFRYMTA